MDDEERYDEIVDEVGKGEKIEESFNSMLMKVVTALAMFGLAVLVLVLITVCCVCRVIRKRRSRWHDGGDHRFRHIRQETNDSIIEL